MTWENYYSIKKAFKIMSLCFCYVLMYIEYNYDQRTGLREYVDRRILMTTERVVVVLYSMYVASKAVPSETSESTIVHICKN
jgi:hypothetical protein